MYHAGWAWAGNTPLKRFKRDTHEGGVCDPLIVQWPQRLKNVGETRHQYLHIVDVLPTLLDVIGIEAPQHINGVEQAPFNGVSFAHTLESAAEPSKHITQYYEMLGSRALYHDGWKAVVFHPPGMMNYESGNVNPSFDDDIWELYNIANDFSECNDVASQFPDKLKELQQLWWSEAEANQVLPLNNQPARYGGQTPR